MDEHDQAAALADCLTRWRVAFHEAGHALAYEAFGVEVISVSITEGGGKIHGVTRTRGGKSLNRVRRLACVLAGPMAEAKHARRSFKECLVGNELEKVKELSEDRSADTYQESWFFDRAQEIAHALIEVSWDNIRALATELNAKGYIDMAARCEEQRLRAWMKDAIDGGPQRRAIEAAIKAHRQKQAQAAKPTEAVAPRSKSESPAARFSVYSPMGIVTRLQTPRLMAGLI